MKRKPQLYYGPAVLALLIAALSLTRLNDRPASHVTKALFRDGVNSHYVTLSWTASTSSVDGYNVYRRNGSEGRYTKLSQVKGTTYRDDTVRPGHTYFYLVKAVDAKGVESQPSIEVRAEVPR